MKALELAPEAGAELVEAAGWYEAQRAGLAAKLVSDFEATSKRICTFPASFPRLVDVPRDLVVRRALLSGFPYALVFIDLDEIVRVIAFAHQKRRPGYWLDRVS